MTLEYDYQILNDALLDMGAICSVAELQGMFCGQLSGVRDRSEEEWLEEMRDFADLSHFDITAEQRDLVVFLLERCRTELDDDAYQFQPLLPDDQCPLTDRAVALGAWCRGYLHGFGASGVTKDTQIPPEVAEVIRDLAQISQAVKEVEGEEEETEADWIELVEYLRAAVFTVYGEMRPAPAANVPPSGAGNSH